MNAPDIRAAMHGGRPRIPDAPYPGLRPFLDHEEILLFGRERQVREILDKLQQTQFVAVIGGSGSGKSSLVLAGVVPELRSFGIPGAGDFWVPMVCTPGTNASQADQEKRLNTPITRLARKFAALLRSRGSPEQDAARLDEIAARLRVELGFSTLVELYTDELAAAPGPAVKDARFLIVIDQFEELFHPTTHNVEDARLLVERVIDHFFSPHPRCYIVLTMRSEHLNDCAGYLELPDAINKASYLVRRLDEAELREAITSPPRRLLRLKQLSEDSAARLPDEVEFDAAVMARLLKDVKSISNDPDHLPLLQHVLARVWQAAEARVAGRLDLPDRILPGDLETAVSAVPPDTAPKIDDGINVLRASVENWAEAAYRRYGAGERKLLDIVLPKLGVRDPNTGMYSQQRVDVDECARLLGPGKTRDDLEELIREGFVGEVEYLFWDDYDPQRITLKVSHESLIRGWGRLRSVIDKEAERFAEFVELLRKCDKWKRSGQADKLLLSEGDLQRVGDAALEAVLANPSERAAWFGRLSATTAFANLSELGSGSDIDAFVRGSLARQQQRRFRARRRRRNRLWMVAGGILLVPPVLYFGLVQEPAADRMELLLQGSILARRYVASVQSGVGSQKKALQNLLDAAAKIDSGREGSASPLQRINRKLLDTFAEVPFLEQRAALVERIAAVTEPTVNEALHRLLTSAIWETAWPGDATKVKQEKAENATCKVTRWDGQKVVEDQFKGQLFSSTYGKAITRYIFVPEVSKDSEEGQEVVVYTAKRGKECRLMQELRPVADLFKIPEDPKVAFDANLRFFWVVNNQTKGKNATLFEIDSVMLDNHGNRRARLIRRVQLTGEKDIADLNRTMSDVGPVLETARMKAGRALKVGDKGWRIVDTFAQPILDAKPAQPISDVKPAQPISTAEAGFRPLLLAPEGSACSTLGPMLKDRYLQDNVTFTILEDVADTKHCFSIAFLGEEGAFLATVAVGVFVKPSREVLAGEEQPARIAVLPRFTRVPVEGGKPKDIEWKVGTGQYTGWLHATFADLEGNPYRSAAPWSTCALYRLGKEVLAQQPEKGVCEGR